MKTPAACGSWDSPVSEAMVTEAAPGLDFLTLDNGSLYWVESRPWEAGRSVLMVRKPDGTVKDVLPAPWSVQSKVHEYGGICYCIKGSSLWFVNAADQAIYCLEMSADQPPRKLTSSAMRFADFSLSARGLIAVAEDHSQVGNDGGLREPENLLVAIDLDSGEVNSLARGADFYASPRVSPDGNTLCWLQWNHPNMPWDETALMSLKLNGAAAPETRFHHHQVSINEPRWRDSHELLVAHDKQGFWQLYSNSNWQQPLCPEPGEFSAPLWQFGVSSFAFFDRNTVLASHMLEGRWRLQEIDLNSGNSHLICGGNSPEQENDYSDFRSLVADDGTAYAIAAGATTAPRIVRLSKGVDEIDIIYAPSKQALPDAAISRPKAISFATAGGSPAHGFYYPPTNERFCPQPGELPPVIIKCHGGPTGNTLGTFAMAVQYWTSRGFALFDLNYRGSTGYGRAYRDALRGQWGVADIEDVTAAVKHLAETGLADGKRAIIRGGSAGGYTVLCALTFTDVFCTGASLYGIGDLELLAGDTHKFEARYMERLVGEYPAQKAIYQQRSPLNFVEQLNCPVIFLQGLEDKVVPPNQAETMVSALQKKGVHVEYVTFPDEGHGFRKAENIVLALQRELGFYRRVLDC